MGPAISWTRSAVVAALGLAACSSTSGPTPSRETSEVTARAAPLALATRYSCAVRGERVVCWGRHPRFVTDSGATVYAELSGSVELAAGDSMLCGRRADGTVRCNDRLFFASYEPSTVTFAEVRGVRDTRAVAVGDSHACVLSASGDVVCWGKNDLGQLGDQALDDRGTPPRTPVVRHATTLSARGSTTCALVEGQALCWGRALGTENVTGPTRVPGIVDAVSVAVGARHACTLDRAGHVKCWGDASSGALTPPAGTYDAIASGGDVSCARARGGDVVCWGARATADETTQPAQRAGGVALGITHGCALQESGEVACWGANDDAQVLGSSSRVRPPSRVANLTDAIDVRTHSGGRCALRRSGRVVCWGRLDPLAHDGQQHYRVTRTPVERAGVEAATALAVGAEHGCALVADGRLRCWGSNDTGQLGTPDASDASDAREVPGIEGARAVCAAALYTCVLDASARVRCVGACGEGGWATREWLPIAGTEDTTEIACGGSFACARRQDGSVSCWGDALTTDMRMIPGRAAAQVPARPPRARVFATGAERIWVGDTHACLRRADRTVACFGYGDTGQLGVSACGGSTTRCVSTRTPVVLPGAETADDLALARGTCLLRAHRPIECIGARDPHYDGFSLEPAVLAGTENAVGFTPGCALERDGHVVCWGGNSEGEVGDGVPLVLASARVVPMP